MQSVGTIDSVPESLTPIAPVAQDAALTMRLARDARDITAAQKLRFEVFNRELRLGLAASSISGLDQDVYDGFCDHLLVVDNRSGDVVGTYRLLSSSRKPSFGFYSETEFELDNIKRSGLRLLELGRGCVAPPYRNGRVINLLFQGIAAYARAEGAEALMGCASIHGHDPASMRTVNAYLRRHHYAGPEFWVIPRRGFDIPGFEGGFDADEATIFRMLPPLFKGYLRLGAKVCGPPAFDRQFGTVDFLVCADLRNISGRYRRPFFG